MLSIAALAAHVLPSLAQVLPPLEQVLPDLAHVVHPLPAGLGAHGAACWRCHLMAQYCCLRLELCG